MNVRNVRCATLALVALIQLGGQEASKLEKIRVSGSRPLSEAADWLEKRFGIPVNYEDPKYLSASNIQDITDEVVSAAARQTNPAVRVLVPRRAQVEIVTPLPSGTPTQERLLELASSVVSEHNRSGNPGTFRAISSTGTISVVPAWDSDLASGQMHAAPLLDTVIRLNATQGMTLETLRDVLKALEQASGTKVLIGMVPQNLLHATVTAADAGEAPARDILTRMIRQMRWKDARLSGDIPRMSWRLYYDPGNPSFVLNLHVVMAESKSIEGETILSPVRWPRE